MSSPRTLVMVGLLGVVSLGPAVSAQQVEPGPSHSTGFTPPEISEQRLGELIELLTPDPGAPWKSVAWRIDLLAAQREAAVVGKPLFLWAMDGHPLGCT